MIKLFTQNSFITDWSEDRNEICFEEKTSELDSFSPTEESIQFLKNFARSFIVDLRNDSDYTIPMA